jgi:hypothetical protein
MVFGISILMMGISWAADDRGDIGAVVSTPPTVTPTKTPELTHTPTPPPPGAIQPIADAYISQFEPDVPLGAVDPEYLQVQGSRGPTWPLCAATKNTLMKFDLSITGAIITTSLVLPTVQYAGPNTGVTLGVWASDDDWDEFTVTWNTRPISTGAPLSTRSFPTASPLVFLGTPELVGYLNSQRPANGGDGIASLSIGWADCPPLSAPQFRTASKDNLSLPPPFLLFELPYRLPHRQYLPLVLKQ